MLRRDTAMDYFTLGSLLHAQWKRLCEDVLSTSLFAQSCILSVCHEDPQLLFHDSLSSIPFYLTPPMHAHFVFSCQWVSRCRDRTVMAKSLR